MNIKPLMTSLALFVLTSAHAQTAKMTDASNQGKATTSHTVTLKKNELLVVAIADQKPDQEAALQTYFNTIMPTAMQNGLSFIGQLHIDKIVEAKSFTPNNFIGLFKWPTMEAAMAFSSEFSPEKLKALRTPIWNEFRGHVIAIPETQNLMINENKVYEVKCVWSKEMIKLNNVSKYGGQIILNQPVAGYEDLKGNQAPSQILIIAWDNEKQADRFNRKQASNLQKEESFYTHFTLFPL